MDSTSAPYFPLLDGRISTFLEQILQKMGPVALSTEVKQRNIVSWDTFLTVTQDSIKLCEKLGSPERDLSHTSLLFHKAHWDCTCHEEARGYWEQRVKGVSAGTAVLHLAGSQILVDVEGLSDAKTFIDAVTPLQIGVHRLMLQGCSSTVISQLADHFHPSRIGTKSFDSLGDEQKMAIVSNLNRSFLDIHCDNEFPARIVELCLKSFQESETGFRGMTLAFPHGELPLQNPLHGTQCWPIGNSYQRGLFTLLLRADSSPPRHLLLRSYPNGNDHYLSYDRITDITHLLSILFDPIDYWIPQSHFSEIRDIFNAPNWPRFA